MSIGTPSQEQQVSFVKPVEIWSTMPGWGIVANLTPHELVVARRIQSIRKYLIIGLVALVLALGGLYGWAWSKSNAANSGLSAEQARTSMLHAQQSKYGTVTKLQGSISQMNTQISQLMSSDVDMSTLVAQLAAALPTHDQLTTVTITISKASVSVGRANSSTPAAGSLNTSGHQIIGSVTLGGKGSSIDSVAAYVNALRKITGVTDVVPTANSGAGGAFNISLSLTDVLLSHRYDVTTTGGSK